MSTSNTKIRVKFVTEFDQFRITDAPFAVPSNLGRSGLSEVINHLLDLDEPQPFDFMIVDRLLRSPLNKFVLYNRLSTEDAIVVEYFPARSLADESKTADTPAWVGCLSCDVAGTILAGCYNGTVDIFDSASLGKKASVAAHQQPVRAVSSWAGGSSDRYFIATASKDQTIKCFDVGHSGDYQLKSTMEGHSNSVESLAVLSHGSSSGEGLLVSGDWNGGVRGWRVTDVTTSGAERATADGDSKKKRKTSTSSSVDASAGAHTVKSVFAIKAHSQCVSGICSTSHGGAAASVYTCSWDHSIKQWDLERQDCVATFAGSKVATSIDCVLGSSAGLVISSHTDGKVRLWDPRQSTVGAEVQTSVGVKATFGNSKNADWVAQVRWQPSGKAAGSAFHFATVDYAGVVGLWDMRTSVPLSYNEVHAAKGLCVAWTDVEEASGAINKEDSVGKKSTVVSGGADCCVKATVVDN